MKQKLVEILYHRLQVNDIASYRIQFKPACLLVQALAKHFEMLSFKAARFTHSVQMDNAHYHFVNQGFYKLGIPFKFHSRIKECQPDVVLIHGTFNHFQIVHLKYLLGKDCKIMVQHHGERPRGWLKRNLLKWSSRSVDAYLFTSRETATEMGIPEKKIKLLMEGSTDWSSLDKFQCRADLGLNQTDKIYLWVGRLVPVKNPLFFLKVFAEFALAHPEAKLFLFYHDESLLQACLKITSKAEGIHYQGKVEQSELRRWYSAADFFVSASIHEGSGYALCEAMACDCVPVVPSIGAFQFITNNGDCALMYAAQDTGSLKKALNKSLELEPETQREKLRQQFKTRLSFEAIAHDLFEITQSLR